MIRVQLYFIFIFLLDPSWSESIRVDPTRTGGPSFVPAFLQVIVFKVDRLQIILVGKKIYIYVSQLFISRMPKMRAIPQLVSAPLNPIPIAEHFRRSHPPCEHSHGQCISEENNAK